MSLIPSAPLCKLADPVNDEFLNQVGAVGDTGNESGAGNCNSAERQPRTNRAKKKRSPMTFSPPAVAQSRDAENLL